MIEPVHRFEHQHFGQHELALGGRLQLGGGLVAQPQQLVPSDRVLVALDPLEDVLLVVLLVGVAASVAGGGWGGPPWRSAWLDVHRHFIELETVPQAVLDLVGDPVGAGDVGGVHRPRW